MQRSGKAAVDAGQFRGQPVAVNVQTCRVPEGGEMTATRLAFMRVTIAAGVMLVAGLAGSAAPAKQGTGTEELVQYVTKARTAGLDEAAILRGATNAGWSAAAVKEALARTPAKAPGAPPAPAGQQGEASPATREGTEPPAKERGVPGDYQIGAGDVVQISVWKEPEASVPQAVVRPDGRISLPLLKEIQVVGLTPVEVEKIVTAQLSKFYNTPDVTVVVTGINSKKIYVIGGVKREGPIPYTYRMSVMQAISEAGGLTDYAKRKRIYVLRSQNGKDFRLPFDYDSVLKGQRMELNVAMLPGDTLVVPK
jgi:polysaccharide export outer membrane protein